ncbi:XRE family transcriptional regulator, partial [Lactobacillus taiwanensis]|uniref:XRE family transcriptional regulator n=1 Tax=Lactobacillus taiwanensis TaxID=508451 RepID=UPI000B99D4AF
MVSNVTPIFKFNYKKLRFLRKKYGCSLRELADKIDYSTTTISKWEKGQSVPTNEIVAKLATIFDVHENFFWTSDLIPNINGTVFFRKGAVLPKKNKIEAESKIRLFALIDQKVSLDCNLKQYQLYDLVEKNKEFKALRRDDIAKKAVELRQVLNLGTGPIYNMTHVAERMGIRVMFSDLESENIDAITGWINEQPYIILNSRRLSSARIRFNLAHEIGHILLHSKYSQHIINNTQYHKEIEHEANQFAGLFLISDRSLALDMDKTNMKFLIELKKKWGLSLQALIYRGNEIDLISDQQALFLRQTIYRNSWRIHEPLDKVIPIEYPNFYEAAFKYLDIDVKRFITEISIETGLKISDIK